MAKTFESVGEAFLALSNTEDPDWMAAFSFFSAHPETSRLMLETFEDTLTDMGVEPGGMDPTTGEPIYTLADVAKALGIPEEELGAAIGQKGNGKSS